MLDPARTLSDLKELRTLTGDENGAHRVAFTPGWTEARRWLRDKFTAVTPHVKNDPAGNLWATIPGDSDREVIIGGHIDSVPDGGWLDGCLDTLAGLEVLRAIAANGRPPVTVRLVDWADEEGARFGRSLFGSSAAAGTLVPDEVRDLRDGDNITLAEAARQCGIELHLALEAKNELNKAAAYVELHIEQGPVLEDRGLAMGVVLGTFGVERHTVTMTGQTAHAGSTPMHLRRDAMFGCARLQLSVRDIALRHGGVGTVGSVKVSPGIATAIAGEATMTVDLRNLSPDKLANMLDEVRTAADQIAEQERLVTLWETLCRIPPQEFDDHLIALADAAVTKTCGKCHRLPSGPLHDATQTAAAGIPTVMLFVQSVGGISHHKSEDTREEHIELAVKALYELVASVMLLPESANANQSGA